MPGFRALPADRADHERQHSPPDPASPCPPDQRGRAAGGTDARDPGGKHQGQESRRLRQQHRHDAGQTGRHEAAGAGREAHRRITPGRADQQGRDRRSGLSQLLPEQRRPGPAPRNRAGRCATCGAQGERQAACGDRPLLAEPGQGDACRAFALHHHRRCGGPGAGVPRRRGDPAEPRRRLGHPVRDADRVSGKTAAGKRRRDGPGRPRRFLSRSEKAL